MKINISAQILVVIICILFLGNSHSMNIICSYSTKIWDHTSLKSVYECDVHNNPNITSKHTTLITSAWGHHSREKSNDNVTRIDAWKKTIHYFPSGLQNIFQNLIVIDITKCGLKEINQSDLRPFPQLMRINLAYNDINVLEEGLFDGNSQLEYINFKNNKIFHIDSKVFGHLYLLVFLNLKSNRCIDIEVYYDGTKVKEIVRQIKSLCKDEEYMESRRNLI